MSLQLRGDNGGNGMTQPTHDEVIAWIDEEIAKLNELINNPCAWGIETEIEYRASLLANRDVLGLHCASSEPDNYETIGCVACGYNSEYNQYLQKFPCPTYQGIYNRISEVM